MSYFDSLKNGNIPEKKKKNAYDEHIEKKGLRTADEPKNISRINPKSFNDIEVMIERLRNKQGVIVDLSGVNVPTAQRMLDFLSGAVCALEGTVERIGKSVYIMTPKNITVNCNL